MFENRVARDVMEIINRFKMKKLYQFSLKVNSTKQNWRSSSLLPSSKSYHIIVIYFKSLTTQLTVFLIRWLNLSAFKLMLCLSKLILAHSNTNQIDYNPVNGANWRYRNDLKPRS
mgnify:CR=1 FL=1